jgi:hypothetical protein
MIILVIFFWLTVQMKRDPNIMKRKKPAATGIKNGTLYTRYSPEALFLLANAIPAALSASLL